MKNSKLRRALLLLACAVLLVSLSVGATLAYLTSTAEVKNTFTVGSVKIKLDEADIYQYDEEGTTEANQGTAKTDAARVTENVYKVYPNGKYDKDPTVHIEKGSEKCYIGVTVKLSDAQYRLLLADNVLGYTETDGGKYIGFGEVVKGGIFNDTTIVYKGNGVWEGADVKLIQDGPNFYIIYLTEKDASTAQVDLVLFEKIHIPSGWGNDELAAMGGLTMDIKAYAVQKDGFNDADSALLAAFPDEFKILETR